MMKIDSLSKYVPYIVVSLVLAIVLYVRIRLMTVPLERDEGEFAYMGQLLLKGIPPFTHAYTMKLPGVSVVYAFFMFLFGQTPAGIHVGLIIVNGACIYLVYLLTKRLFDGNAALFSCASYAVLSLSCSVEGLFAHATHFVVLFALAGFLLLLRSNDKRQIVLLLISGLCFGMAITMKQHAVLLFIFAVLYLLWCVWKNPLFDKRARIAGSFLFLLGTIIPYALIAFWMVEAGSFANFWFWTVQYAYEYTSSQTLEFGWNDFKDSFSDIAKSQLPLWFLAGFGGILLVTKKKCCDDKLFVFGFLVFSFLSICPGLFFRGHYFILILPSVAIMIGAGISSCLFTFKSVMYTQFIQTLLFITAITYSLYHEKNIFYELSPVEVSRATYGANPFPESLQIANYIKNHSTSDEKIAVLGSEPEILFYADRLSATGHIYMYGLMENQPNAERMQMQMIREIEAARPTYIVFVNVPSSWLVRTSSIKAIFNWGGLYIDNLYDPVGVIDIGTYSTRYIWDNEAVGYTPISESIVKIFKRKSGV
ncbi:MAG: glycosyltransferase family 39 protein [Desulfuromonadales bacterium]|nr:glycosyltransferase family 39 protein [Desulfuromonadales bacterium]